MKVSLACWSLRLQNFPEKCVKFSKHSTRDRGRGAPKPRYDRSDGAVSREDTRFHPRADGQVGSCELSKFCGLFVFCVFSLTWWLTHCNLSLARWTKSTSGCGSKRIPHWSALSEVSRNDLTCTHCTHLYSLVLTTHENVDNVENRDRRVLEGPLFGNRGASNLWILCCDSSCYVSAQRVEAWYILLHKTMNSYEFIWILWVLTDSNFKVSNGTPWKCSGAALCEGASDFTWFFRFSDQKKTDDSTDSTANKDETWVTGGIVQRWRNAFWHGLSTKLLGFKSSKHFKFCICSWLISRLWWPGMFGGWGAFVG